MAEHERDDFDRAVGALLRAGADAAVRADDKEAGGANDQAVVRYVDGAMDARERAAFELMLLDEPALAARVAVLSEALTEAGFGPAASAAPIGRRALALASRFVFTLSGGALTFLRGSAMPEALTPALAVRSRAPAVAPSFFEFVEHYGSVDARLALESSGSKKVDVRIEVTEKGAPLEGVRVKLLRDGSPIDSVPSEKGLCTLATLPPARYELEIRKGGIEIGRIFLDLRDDGAA